MRKLVVILATVAICLSLCGFSGVDPVARVEGLIDGIGVVTIEKEQYIVEAETMYNQLFQAEKDRVRNADRLVQARIEYIEAWIDAIGTVTTESEQAILDAETIYNAATYEQQQQVRNYGELANSRVAYAEAWIDAAISASSERERAFLDAKKVYSKLTSDQKSAVGNYEELLQLFDSLILENLQKHNVYMYDNLREPDKATSPYTLVSSFFRFNEDGTYIFLNAATPIYSSGLAGEYEVLNQHSGLYSIDKGSLILTFMHKSEAYTDHVECSFDEDTLEFYLDYHAADFLDSLDWVAGKNHKNEHLFFAYEEQEDTDSTADVTD